MSITFKSSGYRVDATEGGRFLVVIFTENGEICYRPATTDAEKEAIVAKREELRKEGLSK